MHPKTMAANLQTWPPPNCFFCFFICFVFQEHTKILISKTDVLFWFPDVDTFCYLLIKKRLLGFWLKSHYRIFLYPHLDLFILIKAIKWISRPEPQMAQITTAPVTLFQHWERSISDQGHTGYSSALIYCPLALMDYNIKQVSIFTQAVICSLVFYSLLL